MEPLLYKLLYLCKQKAKMKVIGIVFFLIACIVQTIYAEGKGKYVLKDGRTWNYIMYYSSGENNDTIYGSYMVEGPVEFDGKSCYQVSGGGTMFYEEDNCVYSYSPDYLTGEKTWRKELDFNMTLGMDNVLSVDSILVGNQLCRRINLGYDIWVEGIGGRKCGIVASWGVPVPGSYRGSRVLSVYDGDECIFREEDFRKPAYTTDVEKVKNNEYTDTLTNVVYTYNPNDNSAEVKAEVRTIYHDSGGGFSEEVKPGSPDVSGDVAILDKFMIEGHEYTVSQIGRGAFIYYCDSLTAVTLPETIVSIGDVAFYCCYSLVRVEIPRTVTSIGRGAFGQCINLVSVVSHIENPFDTDAFELLDTSEITLFVPKGCSMKYKAVNGWRNFDNIVEMEATGIPLPQKIEQTKTKDTIFNLQGRHLSVKPQKGLYIQNGKKMIVK